MAEGTENKPKSTSKPRKAPEATGPIKRREMTQIRDEVGRIRDEAAKGAAELGANMVPQFVKDLNALYSRLDRMDLRFKLHHDKAPAKKK